MNARTLLAAISLFIVMPISSAHTVLIKEPPSNRAVQELSQVVVSADDVGPRVWEYRRGGSRVLVLGSIFPEPKHLAFSTNSIEMAINSSDVVLGPPGVVIGDNLGIVRTLTLWPSVRKLKYLSDGRRLEDILPPHVWRRWSALKSVYLTHDREVDRMLPMYAGWKLFEAVLNSASTSVSSRIGPTVKRVARAQRKKIIDGRFYLAVDEPKMTVRSFRIDPQTDVACLESTMSEIEAIPHFARDLGDAWSGGDVPGMRALLGKHKAVTPCWSHLTDDAIAEQQHVDLNSQVQMKWMAVLEQTVAEHSVVFTTAPVENILHNTGRIGWLRLAGYERLGADEETDREYMSGIAPHPSLRN